MGNGKFSRGGHGGRSYGLLAGLCLLFAPGPASAAPVSATVNAVVKATVLKPLALTRLGDLDLGTVILNPGTWSGASVSVSAAGVRTCSGNVTCAGAVSAARYGLTGTAKQTVVVSAPAVVMTNSANPSQKLTLSLLAPATVLISNSGSAGVNFAVGGTIALSSTTPPGVYTGTLEVTVDYQ